MAMTPQERRALALQEVHHKRPTGLQAVTTLEISHPGMIDGPARVVADRADLTALLETGETVLFKAVAFRSIGPAQSDSRWPEVDVSIDGASGIIEPLLEQALTSDTPISVTFREYIRERALEGPGRIFTGLELDRTKAGDLTISGVARFAGMDSKFGKTYDPSIYTGLR